MKDGRLKPENSLPIGALLLANLAFFYVAVSTPTLDWEGLLASTAKVFNATWSVVLGVLGYLAVGLLDHTWKARIVFWRWRNPLPGCFAFSRYMTTDPRIDARLLERKLGRLPEDPVQQNVIWYKLYRATADDPAVRQNHREYLLMRDYTAVAFLFFLSSPFLFFGGGSFRTAALYCTAMAVQYFLTRISASNYGVRLVNSVLAKTSSEVSC